MLLLLPACGEAQPEATCDAQCGGGTSLSGSIALPKETQLIDAAFCYPAGCITGILDLQGSGPDTVCVSADSETGQIRVCAKRVAAEALEVEGVLETWGGRPRPSAGEAFSLRLAEHDSGAEVLNERQRAPEYTPHETCGQTCWSAAMTF
ncbi:MAG TPA: hypothetical protein VM686_09330 [Polyangiaceae bacterium]|nr:hypothetical protein [Polyangiaceae bacterium]